MTAAETKQLVSIRERGARAPLHTVSNTAFSCPLVLGTRLEVDQRIRTVERALRFLDTLHCELEPLEQQRGTG